MQSLTLVKNVGYCWMLLGDVGIVWPPYPTKSRWRRRSGKIPPLIWFDFPILTTMEYRQHDLRYETRQVLSDEREGGCSCRPMFNTKRVLLERGMHVGKLSIEKG